MGKLLERLQVHERSDGTERLPPVAKAAFNFFFEPQRV